MRDQALALAWVKDNIEYFGGDRDQVQNTATIIMLIVKKVTIFGESAGGWSVSQQLVRKKKIHL